MKLFRLSRLPCSLCPAIAVGAKPNILLLYADDLGFGDLGWDWDAIRKPGTKKNGIRPEDFDWSKPIPDGPASPRPEPSATRWSRRSTSWAPSPPHSATNRPPMPPITPNASPNSRRL